MDETTEAVSTDGAAGALGAAKVAALAVVVFVEGPAEFLDLTLK